MSNAGNFEIRVTHGSYPAWCVISYAGKHLRQIHHNELSDLQYAITKAIQEARIILKKDAVEV